MVILQWDLIDVVDSRPEVLGVAIDENTAIVVQGDEFEVIGENYVAVTDATTWQQTSWCANYELACGPGRPLLAHNGKFFFLKAHTTGGAEGTGDKYNLRTREVTRQSCGTAMDW